MTKPNAFKIEDLNRSWGKFISEKRSLDYIIKEAKKKVGQALGTRGYTTKDSSDLSMVGFFIKRSKGRLKKKMSGEYFWVWCGVYFWDEEACLAIDIGWPKKDSTDIFKGLGSKLQKRGFYHYESDWDNFETFSFDETCKNVIGKRIDITEQEKTVSNWLLRHIRIAAKLIDDIERKLR